ncbi:hypothetical protein Droror1_Dr00016071 [Drosera rotundifolia]
MGHTGGTMEVGEEQVYQEVVEAVHSAVEEDQDEAEERRTSVEGMVGGCSSRLAGVVVVQKSWAAVARKDHEVVVVVSEPLYDTNDCQILSVSFTAALLANKATIDANSKVTVEHRSHMLEAHQEAVEEAHMAVVAVREEVVVVEEEKVEDRFGAPASGFVLVFLYSKEN